MSKDTEWKRKSRLQGIGRSEITNKEIEELGQRKGEVEYIYFFLHYSGLPSYSVLPSALLRRTGGSPATTRYDR